MAIDIAALSSPFEVRKRNRNRSHSGADQCILCEAPIRNAPAGFIHVCLCCNRVLIANGERCPDGYDEDGRGGCGSFPVGSGCIKRVPAEYRE